MKITINTYKELKERIQMFKDGVMDLIIIESRGGLGKSTSVRKALGKMDYLFVNTHMTPMQLHVNGFHKKDLPIWFDDVNLLLKNQTINAQLKQFCETTEEKHISYNSPAISRFNVPQEYFTKSRCLLTCNDIGKIDSDLKALFTRGLHIVFQPTNNEILRRAKSFCKDEEVLSVVKNIMNIVEDFNMRLIYHAMSYKKHYAKEWKTKFIKDLDLNEKLKDMIELLSKDISDKKRINEWNKLGRSRADYFRWKNKVLAR